MSLTSLTGFRHEVAFYRGMQDLADQVLPFVREGVQRREPVLVAMLPERLDVLERALGDDALRVDFVDMSELGANPACIIPEWRRFLEDNEGTGQVRGVGEPVWPGRRQVELAEAQLHEGLLNLAFDGGPAWRLLCPYDLTALPVEVVEEARRSHPVVHPETVRATTYAGDHHAVQIFSSPLTPHPEDATVVAFGPGDLAVMRKVVRRVCEAGRLGGDTADDLVLAAHELVANSVRHGGGAGVLRIWDEPGALVVEVQDTGRIDDPLVGRGLVDLAEEAGRGIWMANQLCDLVQVRSGEFGTQVRLYSWL
ncbi:sensor histidine kinase [Nocardioides mesophilus]|uniref:Sensor histidine kinase n=1 Tax=Nocardioides mesophilus TaxID=433659 RepID=A0A7G9REX4_9ACTN|nr:sensor histidine kinase [Nocardioides mesophilus]QNN54149.1 sensor histidine kinase [Nocardioides mesophilus]